MTAKAIILAPNGFPWRSLAIGIAVIFAGMGVGLYVIGAGSVGGTFVVSAMIGIAAFAASLG
ncbi:hypothetical protein [Magnetospirillum moscoviense]|uniref:Uncharacterized protein n=1 Tax=Magnetospirillum moscoviense TaxID=1437059 RepID=A0A178MPP5_9PROT|nr:hypothetical protein [Magnetospirillum moscoviense]MBF0323797.1 hypothetical protein [Alphaproteobacteria bacterium]OAN50609.1 hypothetical protein A6A05_12055 [Magnetospirillum moscoviense]